jgi:TetR/AcrR family transcriptional regulator, cholesterol catabolism regulator
MKIMNYKSSELLEARKEQIINSASNLFLKKGYERTSIRDIARECNIAMGTLYHYIKTKENLLRMVVEYHNHKNDKIVKDIQAATESSDPTEALILATRIFLDGIDKHKKIFVFVFTEAKLFPKDIRAILLATESIIVDVFENILIEGCTKNIFEVENPELSAHNIVSLIEMWGLKWWYLKGRTNREEFELNLNNFILLSVRKVDN